MVATSSPMPLAAIGDVATIDVRGYGSATVTFEGGTVALAGGTVILEATNVDSPTTSDYVPVMAARSDDPTGATFTPINNGTLAPGITWPRAYRLNTAGYTYIRARVTGRTSGDILAQWSRDTMPVEPVPAAPAPASSVTVSNLTAGGLPQLLVTAATTNATSWSGGTSLDEISISNPTATPAYVKLFNKGTAPTPGSDVPIVIIPAPAGTFVSYSFGATGKRFSTGLGVAVTGAAASLDATASVAGVIVSATRR